MTALYQSASGALSAVWRDPDIDVAIHAGSPNRSPQLPDIRAGTAVAIPLPMRRLVLSVSVLFLGFGSMGVMCVSADGPPEPDSCAAGSYGAIDTLELGHGDEGTFVPVRDGDTVPLTYGGQGGVMMSFRVRAAGSDVPACMANRIRVTSSDGQESYGVSTYPLRTYEDGAGGRSTATAWVVLGPRPYAGDEVTVTVTVGQMTVTYQLVVGAAT